MSEDPSSNSQEERLDLTYKGETMQLDVSDSDNLPMPQNTQRFLIGIEHLLSVHELNSFQQLFATNKFDVNHVPYKALLLLKKCYPSPYLEECIRSGLYNNI